MCVRIIRTCPGREHVGTEWLPRSSTQDHAGEERMLLNWWPYTDEEWEQLNYPQRKQN